MEKPRLITRIEVNTMAQAKGKCFYQLRRQPHHSIVTNADYKALRGMLYSICTLYVMH